MLVTATELAMTVPNIISIGHQVRLVEEPYLIDTYRAYARQVRRFPGLGHID